MLVEELGPAPGDGVPADGGEDAGRAEIAEELGWGPWE